MPEWFRMLGIITMAVIMVVLLAGIAGGIAVCAWTFAKDVIEEYRFKQKMKQISRKGDKKNGKTANMG